MATSKIKKPTFTTKVFSMTDNTIAGGAAYAASLTSSQVALDGYNPVGVVTVNKSGSGHTDVLIYQFGFTDAGALVVGLKNIGQNERIVSVTCRVLYMSS